MTKKRHLILPLLALVFLLTAGLRMIAAPGDKSPALNTSGWIQRIPYDPPNSSQTKFEFSGTEASPIPNSGGKALLKGVKIKEFSLAGGKPQMVAETPECVADSRFKEVGSAQPLTVHAQEDKFFVEGVGFFLRQADSRLVISNDVHSILQLQSTTNTPPPDPTEVFSHRAEFQMKTEKTNGVAIYLGNVRVNDPRLQMTCELLIADLPENTTGKSNRVDQIVAETNVVLDFTNEKGERIHATGEKAIHKFSYTEGLTNDLLELTGDPRVELSNGWMTAEMFVMNRTTGKLEGKGDFHFYSTTTNEQKNTPESQISADQFSLDIITRLAQFWGRVRLDDPKIKMSSETLSLILPQSGTSNQLDHVIAESGVAIDFPDVKTGQNIHATSQKAVYDRHVVNALTNEVLVLTGNPTVETLKPAGWMTADVVTLDRANGKISGVGNHHSVIKQQPGEPAAMDTEVFSDEFEFTTDTGRSVYHGQVRTFGPEMNLTGQILTVKLAKTAPDRTNPVERIEADGDVVLDFIEKAFAPGDITNLTAFATKLKTPTNGVSQFINSQLTSPALALLNNYTNGTNSMLQQTLVTELNRLTQSGSIYEEKRFSDVFLSLETTQLMQTRPLGVDLVELNRLLLLDAFRGELKNGEKGGKTHATGNRAVYAVKVTNGETNQVLELSGHPHLVHPNENMTAEDTIIYNRTTGSWSASDKPRLFITLKDVKNMPDAPSRKKQ